MKKKIFLYLIFFLQIHYILSQEKSALSWWDPVNNTFPVIEGQAWPGSMQNFYDRLPRYAQKEVRKEVWDLGRNAAGLLIRFRTNSENISVRYVVSGSMEMQHMPATGVSGVDLYAKNSDGAWMWCSGSRYFGDTVRYEFRKIDIKDQEHKFGREYRLYLPLYNTIKMLRIGVNTGAVFEPLPLRLEKPIVAYGTSIAQGGCASRPGMAWTSILERRMDRPLIKLGFSGNGRMEKEVIELISSIDAKIYILDCLPNLGPNGELKNLLISSVKRLKEKRPLTPVLMAEHAGYGGEATDIGSRTRVHDLNLISRQAYAQLMEEGIDGLYYLSREQIGLNFESFVDGVHPTDFGMEAYASAYEKILRQIFVEPQGISSTTIPVTQSREPGVYDWEKRHEEILKNNRIIPPKNCLIGNSIIHYLGGITEWPLNGNTGKGMKDLHPVNVRNMGFSQDRIENVLWRVYHDELDGYSAKTIMIMTGTDNLNFNSNQEILEGLKLLINAVRKRQPSSSIVLCGLLPGRKKEKDIAGLNLQIAGLAGSVGIKYADFSEVFIKNNGLIDESLFLDGWHPNEQGYQKLTPLVRDLLE